MLRDKTEQTKFKGIARRFQAMASSVETAAPSLPAVVLQESEPTVLEDFILQAEIYLQYGMRSKALERLERASKLFPHAAHKTEKPPPLSISPPSPPPYETP